MLLGTDCMLRRSITARLLIAVVLLSAVLAAPLPGRVEAEPAQRINTPPVFHQTLPDWMPAESAAQLDVGIDVLVPVAVPAPFAGAPQISAASGYYSLYWFVGGGAPTLLQITGTAGGEIPAYSKYDRNVQLVANASVNGATAYRDLTPIYDLVYWKVGNVVYTVESQNSSVDSLSLANSLVVLPVPQTSAPITATVYSPDQITAGNTGNVTVSVNGAATLTTDVGYFTATGESTISVSGDVTVEWQAPTLTDPVTATFQVIDPSDGSVVASTPTQIIVAPTGGQGSQSSTEWGLDCPATGVAGAVVTVTASGSARATLSASDGSFTGGSPAIVLNLDGSRDVDFTMPFDDVASARLTLSDGESAVATCEIALVAETDGEPTATTTALAKGVFPGDGTDLSVPGGKEPTLPKNFGTPSPVPTSDPSKLEGDGTGIIEAALVTPPVVPPTATPTRTPKPGESTATPVPTNTPAPTATFTPENPMPTMVPQVDNNGRLVALEMGNEGGLLNSPFGVQIEVPKETFSDTTSVTLQPVADNQVPLQAGISLVPQSAYDISFAKLNGRGIDLGDKQVTLRVDLGERWTDGATLFQLINGQANAISGVKTNGTVLEAKINGPTRVIAGVPTAQIAGSGRGLVPIIIAALIAVIVLIVASSVLISLRNRRPRTVATRRSLGSRSRF
jgi:hypothetical protein